MCGQVSAGFPAANRGEQILANRQQSIPKSLKRKSASNRRIYPTREMGHSAMDLSTRNLIRS
jgi:hypothetical protein